jgi:hypothetical protein
MINLLLREYHVLAYNKQLIELKRVKFVTQLTFLIQIGVEEWYSTLFVPIPPDVIYLQLCTPKLVSV